LAILKVHAPAPGLLAIRPSNGVKSGEDAFTIGFPQTEKLGTSPKLGKGVISGLKGRNDADSEFQTTVEVHKGNSGGPLLDAYGNVIGIIERKLTFGALGDDLPENVNFALKSDFLLGFLKKFDEIHGLIPAQAGPIPLQTSMIENATRAIVLLEGYQ
jgi:S1-C subfamily serine protease